MISIAKTKVILVGVNINKVRLFLMIYCSLAVRSGNASDRCFWSAVTRHRFRLKEGADKSAHSKLSHKLHRLARACRLKERNVDSGIENLCSRQIRSAKHNVARTRVTIGIADENLRLHLLQTTTLSSHPVRKLSIEFSIA